MIDQHLYVSARTFNLYFLKQSLRLGRYHRWKSYLNLYWCLVVLSAHYLVLEICSRYTIMIFWKIFWKAQETCKTPWYTLLLEQAEKGVPTLMRQNEVCRHVVIGRHLHQNLDAIVCYILKQTIINLFARRFALLLIERVNNWLNIQTS